MTAPKKRPAASAAWTWMPHSAHLIVGNDCRFHLATVVANGAFLVSTVGEWLPSESSWDIFAQSRGVTLEGKGDARQADYMKKVGYLDVGADRKYETMVFRAAETVEHPCCPFTASDFSEIDSRGYNDPAAARLGHMELCAKYDAKKARVKR